MTVLREAPAPPYWRPHQDLTRGDSLLPRWTQYQQEDPVTSAGGPGALHRAIEHLTRSVWPAVLTGGKAENRKPVLMDAERPFVKTQHQPVISKNQDRR